MDGWMYWAFGIRYSVATRFHGEGMAMAVSVVVATAAAVAIAIAAAITNTAAVGVPSLVAFNNNCNSNNRSLELTTHSFEA